MAWIPSGITMIMRGRRRGSRLHNRSRLEQMTKSPTQRRHPSDVHVFRQHATAWHPQLQQPKTSRTPSRRSFRGPSALGPQGDPGQRPQWPLRACSPCLLSVSSASPRILPAQPHPVPVRMIAQPGGEAATMVTVRLALPAPEVRGVRSTQPVLIGDHHQQHRVAAPESHRHPGQAAAEATRSRRSTPWPRRLRTDSARLMRISAIGTMVAMAKRPDRGERGDRLGEVGPCRESGGPDGPPSTLSRQLECAERTPEPGTGIVQT